MRRDIPASASLVGDQWETVVLRDGGDESCVGDNGVEAVGDGAVIS